MARPTAPPTCRVTSLRCAAVGRRATSSSPRWRAGTTLSAARRSSRAPRVRPPRWSARSGRATASRRGCGSPSRPSRAPRPRSWPAEPLFIESLAGRVSEALGDDQEGAPVVLTAHSLPRRVFETDREYVAELRATGERVAAAAGLDGGRWRWAYQSAGHTPEEWLRPDLGEIFPELARAGHRAVLVAPVQFLADHLEVLYDLDVAAAAQAPVAGLAYRRIAMPNADPVFIAALAAVARRTVPEIVRPGARVPPA